MATASKYTYIVLF